MSLIIREITAAGWFHLGYFGVLIPISAFRSRKVLLNAKQALPSRTRHFQQTALSVALLTALSLSVAYLQRISLFPRALPSPKAVFAGVGMYLVAVAIMRPYWRRAVERRVRIVQLFMPATAAERAWWIAVSLLAGIGEEITWRGVQATLAGALTGGFWTAALVSSISFGLAHIVQG